MADPWAGRNVSVSPLWKLLPNSWIVWRLLSAVTEDGETKLRNGVAIYRHSPTGAFAPDAQVPGTPTGGRETIALFDHDPARRRVGWMQKTVVFNRWFIFRG